MAAQPDEKKPLVLPSMTITQETKTPYSDATQVREKRRNAYKK